MRYIGPIFALLLCAAILCPAQAAHAWWNENWQYRTKISFDTTANGANIQENLSEIPILIRLHSGNFNFANAKEDGSDLRFVSSEDLNLLKHHVERFDMIDEIALIWVKLPRLGGNDNQGHIWMYYGYGEAMGGQDAKSTYDAGFGAVYHFDEIEGTPKDSSAIGTPTSAFSGSLGLPAVIGLGLSLNGGGNRLALADNPALGLASGFTFSAWVRIAAAQTDALLFHRGTAETHLRIGIEGTRVYAALKDKEQTWETERSADLPPGAWHQVTVTAVPGQRLTVYLDALEMSFTDLPASPPALTGELSIGAATDGSRPFMGEIDQLEVSTTGRSADWIRASFAAQGPDGLLYAFGVEEMGGGGSGLPTFYLGTIFKNITLDGWVVIGLLVILAVVSWIIFVSKSIFLWMIGKEDRKFYQSFTENGDLFALEASGNGFQNSALYRVYVGGCTSLKKCLNNPEMTRISTPDDAGGKTKKKSPKRLKIKGMNAVKASLERGFIEQSKRLNQWIMVLTLAITGGPFLGLLGTVWGVMNTFAAMAEAGEANIMAIAPGVASALATTVFGLIVAIPALFAYNILAGKIKSMMADLTLFVDSLTVRIDEVHGGS
jgi:biopolymer transport protein ExbB